jgi:ATP-dependent protease ClpP protease subunit
VHEENLIVDLIQVNNLDTLVLGKCASACTGAFLAGNRRYVGPEAKLGFHQAGYRGRPQDTQWDIPEYESSILYRAKGVAQDFSPEALNASYYSLWKPDVYDVKQSGFATNWWSERPKEFQ